MSVPKIDYKAKFPNTALSDKSSIRQNALERAWQIRSFEIDMYWKRAAYFWAFIVAAFVAFGVIASAKFSFEPRQSEFLVAFSCLGFAFSYSWVLVNKGSKFWQENWEKHIDLLEDEVSGPLYKTILLSPPRDHVRWLLGSHPYSVSNINTLISVLVTVFWGFLIAINASPVNSSQPADPWKIGPILFTAFYCCVFLWLGRSTLGKSKEVMNSNLRIIERHNGEGPVADPVPPAVPTREH